MKRLYGITDLKGLTLLYTYIAQCYCAMYVIVLCTEVWHASPYPALHILCNRNETAVPRRVGADSQDYTENRTGWDIITCTGR